MSKRTRSQPSNARREITTPDGLITVPPGSPKILIHTRQGKCVGIYSDQPVKVLYVETQDDPRRMVDPSNLAMLAMISPQTSAKLAGGFGTAVDHVLAPSANTADHLVHRLDHLQCARRQDDAARLHACSNVGETVATVPSPK